MSGSFARRLVLLLALLLLALGAFVALLVRHAAAQQDQALQQRLSRGLAGHIVSHWPELSTGSGDAGDEAAQGRLLQMLMVVNPGIQVYLLSAEGAVARYLGEPGMVRTQQVDLGPVRRFLAGAALPLPGTDPMGGAPRVFSVAMFPPRPGQSQPAGYLYIVLEGPAHAAALRASDSWPFWRAAGWAAAAGLLAALAVGGLVLWRLTRPLNRLAMQMQTFGLDVAPEPPPLPSAADEVQVLAQSFQALTRRIGEQARQRQALASEHREVMANLAHDLRTPLTALHGHLEALARPVDAAEVTGDGVLLRRGQLLAAALAQSDKLRRLTQQLFELATLQGSDQVLRERFRLDELVADTVQKFELLATPAPVVLVGPAPGAVSVDGDLHLIERALTNLIDNAVRHAACAAPVQVSLHCEGPRATVVVQDQGPGLPPELGRRLDAGHPVREPPQRRAGGGIGGLGLAIAQRIAALHGGSLRTQPAEGPGTRLVLALPLAIRTSPRPRSSCG